MCQDCGCTQAHHHHHQHTDGTVHAHPQDAPTRLISVQARVLSHNDDMAAQNRAWLQQRRILTLNLISSPGTGKTLLLEKTVTYLKDHLGVAVITGDLQTDHDKQRIARTGVPVEQIETQDACHLDASQIARVLPLVVTPQTRLLFIENVGNLVCPAAFDLGETLRVALLSTTEGEDKPVKYPSLFSQADVVVLTKTDLIPHLNWDLALCRQYIQTVQPAARIFELSARSGEGMVPWCNYLMHLSSMAD
jgi:hydrogenase nickel incorporation protein HypB